MKHKTALRPLAYQPNDLELHNALEQAVHQHLSHKNDHRFADRLAIAKMGFLVLICLGCYWMSLRQSTSMAFFGWYFGFIFSGMLLIINVMHDASHNAFFRTSWANVLINRLVSIPLGLDPESWRVRHVIFHHTHTNISGYDPDIDENGVLRQTPFQQWKPFMRLQHWYWPVVAALTFPWYIWLVDWLDRAGQTRVTERLARKGITGWTIFLGSKGSHFMLALAIPTLVLPKSISLPVILMIYFFCQMIASLLFVIILVGTHWAKAKFFEAPEQGNMPHNRYQHIFATTFDWHTRPIWVGYWLGGANLHLTHHLFPHWNHRHYPELSQLIADVAAQFDLDYQNLSVSELLHFQYRYLKEMGVSPQNSPSDNDQ